MIQDDLAILTSFSVDFRVWHTSLLLIQATDVFLYSIVASGVTVSLVHSNKLQSPLVSDSSPLNTQHLWKCLWWWQTGLGGFEQILCQFHYQCVRSIPVLCQVSHESSAAKLKRVLPLYRTGWLTDLVCWPLALRRWGTEPEQLEDTQSLNDRKNIQSPFLVLWTLTSLTRDESQEEDTSDSCHGGNLTESAATKADKRGLYCTCWAGGIGGACASAWEFAFCKSEVLEMLRLHCHFEYLVTGTYRSRHCYSTTSEKVQKVNVCVAAESLVYSTLITIYHKWE